MNTRAQLQSVAQASEAIHRIAAPSPSVFVETRTRRAQPAWLFSPAIDYACAGGLTFLIFLPVLLLNITAPRPELIGTLLIWGNILVNCPHYAATYYRVYRDKSEILKYPVEAIIAPIVLSFIAAACFVYPTIVTPWVAYAYLAISGYHYAGQTYGVSMIFAGKSGLRLTDLEKYALRLPIYSAYLYTLVNLNVADGDASRVLDILVPRLNIPPVVLNAVGIVVIAAVMCFVALNAVLHRRHGRVLPLVVNVVIAAHVVWFTMVQFPILMAAVPFLHCLQYLFVTTFFDFKETRAKKGLPNLAPAKYLASSLFVRYYATQVAIGIALFVGLPLLLRSMGMGSRALVGAVVLSVLNLHHFVLDGAIWKLRSPAVAKPLVT